MITISSLSTEYLQIPVTAPDNPTSDVVQFAFIPVMAARNPAEADWHAGAWATVTPFGNTAYQAQILIGPENSGLELGVGTYVIWLSVTDSPEIPVSTAGYLQIT